MKLYMPVYKWFSGLLFVIGDRAAILHANGKPVRLNPISASNVARLVSFADLGITGHGS